MSFIYLPLEKAINFYLSLDAAYTQKLAPLAGKIIQLDVKPVTFYFTFDDSCVRVCDKSVKPADTIISGHPLALLKLATNQDASFSLFGNDLSIQGDIEAGQLMQKLFNELDIDWEEHLSTITGDIVANQFATLVGNSKVLAKKAAKNMQQNLSEFLQEEMTVLPPKEEAQDFFNDVDALKLRIDRLSARVKRLQDGEQ